MHRAAPSARWFFVALCFAVAVQTVAFVPKANAQTLTTIYSFCARSKCADGARPSASLLQAADGELWGTTWEGGANGGRTGTGTVFKITTAGALTTVHSFCARTGCLDGASPVAGLMLATVGVLFAGLIGLTRKDHDPYRSNRLMRYRVLLQAGTLVLFGLLLHLLRS